MDRDAARAQINQIIERFRANINTDINEQQTRMYYVLPLFQALGWDIHNPAEMSAEEQISRGFVDFGFYLNGVPAFYLETKRASEKLEKPEHMKQAINYSYMKGVTWAVLTDFNGLMVFNAEVEGNPLNARMFNLKYTDYLSDLGFEDLWLLSKQSLQKREIDRVAERYGKKNKREPVTKQLFADLTQWRRDLFREMYIQRTTLWASNPHEVDNAVQRFLDRLIFIRTVEDRGVERNHLKALLREEKKRSQWFPKLLGLFRELDRVYNSNLFAAHRVDDMEVHNPDLVETIINGLYSTRDSFGTLIDYDFNAITADVLGAVYEQYLGFRAQDPEGKQALDIRKKQKRKQQGIYYTPQFVVRYIVRQTLGKLLTSPPNPLSTLEADMTDEVRERREGESRLLGVEATRKLRILDPACGSGAFLIEAFDVLDKHYEALHAHLSEAERANKRREWRQWILKENLYGVDLDDQAVEVTRLNLMLRGAQTREKLPLLTNIVHGNSLIHDDAIAGASLGLKWKERFFDVMAAGGFDVVIGNPPYIRAENMEREMRDYYMSGVFEVAYGRFDIYILFIERAIKRLKEGGRIGFIIPYPFLNEPYAKLLRKFILDTCSIESIDDLSGFKVFGAATVDTCILSLRKESQIEKRNSHPVIVTERKNSSFDTENALVRTIHQSNFDKTLNNSFRLDLNDTSISLVNKLKKQSLQVGDLCYVITGAVLHHSTTGASKDRLIHGQSKEGYKPYLEAKEMSRYTPPQSVRFLNYKPSEVHRPKFPELFENKKIMVQMVAGSNGLIATYDDKNLYTDHSLHLCVMKHWLYGVPRKQLKKITKEQAQLSTPYDPKFLLAHINSRLIGYYFQQQLEGGINVYPETVRQLPIRRINFDDPTDKGRHDKMVALVEQMLALKQQHAAASTSSDDRRHELQARIDATDKAIDALVYEMYGLTPEEIAIVEGG